MNIPVPPRAVYLRTIWGELSRIHSHLLWLGLMADGMNFESLFMHSWRIREKVLDIIEATTGGRVIFGSCKVGGVRRDIDGNTASRILKEMGEIEADMRDIVNVFLHDSSVKARLCGVGVLTKQEANDLGCVGPMLRASGVAQDMPHTRLRCLQRNSGRADRPRGRRFICAVRRPLRRVVPVGGDHPAGFRQNFLPARVR